MTFLETAVREFIAAVEAHGDDPPSHTDFVSTVLTELPILKHALRGGPDPRPKRIKSININLWNDWAATAQRRHVVAAVGVDVWTAIIKDAAFSPQFDPATKDMALKGYAGRIGRTEVLLPWMLTPGVMADNQVEVMGFDFEPDRNADQYRDLLATAKREGTIQIRVLD